MSTITTRLIGSGHYFNGKVIVWPVTPWVVYDGDYTRPTAKAMKIINQALYELDGITPASVPPSYVASGVVGAVVYPNNNYYGFELFQKGRRALKGFLKVPLDPADNGCYWYNLEHAPTTRSFPVPATEVSSVKTYSTISARNADQANILEGTIIFVVEDSTIYGRTSSSFVPLFDSDGYGSLEDQVVWGETLTVSTNSIISTSSADGMELSETLSTTTYTSTQGSSSDIINFGDSTNSTSVTLVTASTADGLIVGIDDITTTVDSEFETAGLIFGDTPTVVNNFVGSVSETVEWAENFTLVVTEVFPHEEIHFGDSSSAITA